jgi:hypothetical protein
MIPGEQIYLISTLSCEDQIAPRGILLKTEHHATRQLAQYGTPREPTRAQAETVPRVRRLSLHALKKALCGLNEARPRRAVGRGGWRGEYVGDVTVEFSRYGE